MLSTAKTLNRAFFDLDTWYLYISTYWLGCLPYRGVALTQVFHSYRDELWEMKDEIPVRAGRVTAANDRIYGVSSQQRSAGTPQTTMAALAIDLAVSSLLASHTIALFALSLVSIKERLVPCRWKSEICSLSLFFRTRYDCDNTVKRSLFLKKPLKTNTS